MTITSCLFKLILNNFSPDQNRVLSKLTFSWGFLSVRFTSIPSLNVPLGAGIRANTSALLGVLSTDVVSPALISQVALRPQLVISKVLLPKFLHTKQQPLDLSPNTQTVRGTSRSERRNTGRESAKESASTSTNASAKRDAELRSGSNPDGWLLRCNLHAC